MRCPRCRTDIPEGSRFCPSCGAKTAEEQQANCEIDGEAAVATMYPTHYSPGQFVPSSTTIRPARKGRGWLFWVPFMLFFVVYLLLYFVLNSNLAGWAVLLATFALLLLFRGRLSRANVVAGLGIWTLVLVELFVVLLVTFVPADVLLK